VASKLSSLLLLIRPHFLAGGILMYAMGVTAALAEGETPDLLLLFWGQIGVSAIQLMTHFVNEYYDAERDGLVLMRTFFSGGSGVLPSGRLPRRVALEGAAICAAIGVAVMVTVGWPVAPVYGLALVVGFGYSAPPLRLMTRGLGELSAALTVALLTPLAGYGVASGRLDVGVVWLGLPLLATSLAFMVTVELPDYDVDRISGKRNWVVRLGRDRAGGVHNGLLILSYVVLALTAGGLPARVAALLWWTLPLAAWQIGGVWLRMRRGWGHYGLLAGGGMALVGWYGVLAGLGYWLSAAATV
jgi:1,4-dihydroxy-2-naphthoate octaprenyltransferase